MSQYLLLRDNKQSGPYSRDELIEKGFKAYDLIWVEGKSAGWRYPSELPEFKSFTQTTEEQPFDRFFKKTSGQSEAGSSPETVPAESISTIDLPEVTAESSLPPAATAIPASSEQKIFVARPQQRPAARKSAPEEPRQPAQEPGRKAAEIVSQESTLPASDRKESHSAPSPAASAGNWQQGSKLVAYPPEEKLYQAPPRQGFLLNQTLALRAAVALCLILGGVIIGLLINGNRHSASSGPAIPDAQESAGGQQNQIPVHTVAREESGIPSATQPSADQPGKTQSDESSLSENNGSRPAHSKNVERTKEAAEERKKLPAEGSIPVKPQEDNKSVADAKQPPARVQQASQEAVELAKKNIYQLVQLSANHYKVGLLGGISNLEMTVANNSRYPLDRVEILVNYLGPEKKLVRQQSVLVSELEPGGQKTVTVPRSSRGVTISYSIVKISSQALGLAAGF